MKRTNPIWLSVLFGCGHGGDDAGAEPVESYACVHIVEGNIIDVSADREGAHEISVGRDPYRVNLIPGATGYLQFESGAADLVLLSDFAGAAHAVWNGEDRVEITPGEPDPNCDVDLVEVDYLSVPSGTHWLELGPAYQANIWLMLSEP